LKPNNFQSKFKASLSKTSSQTTLWHCAASANTGQIARIWAPDSVGGFLRRGYNYNALSSPKCELYTSCLQSYRKC